MDYTTVLGVPCFSRGREARFSCPVGQERLYAEYWNRIPHKDTEKRADILADEYDAVRQALRATDVPFVTAVPHFESNERRAEGVEYYKRRGNRCVQLLTNNISIVAYPRDYAVRLTEDQALISQRVEQRDSLPQGIRPSLYGDGGRSHVRQKRVLLQRWISEEDDEVCETREPAPVAPFEEAGFNIGRLPTGLVHFAKHTEILTSTEIHIDRWSGLVEDKSGGLHFFIHRDAPSCEGTCHDRIYSPQETVEIIQHECNKLGVTLHVCDELLIPGSLGFAQLATGQVILTAGEPVLEGEIGELVGKDNLFVTTQPISTYPLIFKAGIRCLIGEIPSCLVIEV